MKLIVCADDFGMSSRFDEMILELIEEGAVTTTSLMVERDPDPDQLRRLLESGADIGLHVDFPDEAYAMRIEEQLQKFKRLVGRRPDYLDIHKTTYLKEGYPVIQAFCKSNAIPCKNLSRYAEVTLLEGEITTPTPSFMATGKEMEEIEQWLASLQRGTHCIVVHPGYYDPDSTSSFNRIREEDAGRARGIKAYADRHGIELVGFSSLG